MSDPTATETPAGPAASADLEQSSVAPRTAIVTGAARGIGLATTRLLLARRYRVAMVDRDGPELAKAQAELVDLEAALPAIQGTPSDLTHALDLDVSKPDDVAAMIERTLAWTGRIDALVNNAGVADFGPIEDTTFERWRTVMATNLDGVFLCTQAAIPALKASKGAVVNIASISGLRASTLRTAYGTSKAAVIHLTKQQAAELGEYGIRVNCVCPGPVRTKLAMAVHSQAIINAYHDAIPLNRYGTETEIAHAITFLLSPEASFITGQTLSADGGFESTGIGLPALRGD